MTDFTRRSFFVRALQAAGCLAVAPAINATEITGENSMITMVGTRPGRSVRSIALGIEQGQLLHAAHGSPQGRLSLTDGVAVPASNVSGATTLYFLPAGGRSVPLWDGERFRMTDIDAQLSSVTTDSTKSPGAVAADKVYYALVWSDPATGTVRLSRSPAWSTDTSPGTGPGSAEVEWFQGIPVNKHPVANGPAARLGTVVGAIRSNSSSQLVDSDLFRWVANIFNPAPRRVRVVDTTDNWAGPNNAWRAANNNAANKVSVLFALDGQAVQLFAAVAATGSAGQFIVGGIGLDWVSGPPTDNITMAPTITAVGSAFAAPAQYVGVPGLGRHDFTWLEYASAAGVTFLGDAASPHIQTGLSGLVWG